MTDRIAVIVEFGLRSAESLGAFRTLVDENARQSRSLEPGCRQFDVLVPDGASERVVLYEIYDDRRAFQDHLKTDHYQAFDRQSAHLVKSKSVTELALVFDGE